MTGTPSLEDILTVPDDRAGLRKRYYVLFPNARSGACVRPMIERVDDHECGARCDDYWWTGQDTFRWTPETPVVPT